MEVEIKSEFGRNAFVVEAYSRALRGHLFMDQVLTTLIIILMYDNDELDVNSKSIALEQLYKEIFESKITISDLQENLF